MAKVSPGSHQGQYEISQQQASRRAIGGKETEAYCGMSPLIGP